MFTSHFHASVVAFLNGTGAYVELRVYLAMDPLFSNIVTAHV